MGSSNLSKLKISVKIIYKDEDGKEVSYAIAKKVTTIGKQSDRDIQLSDPYVSRYHADLVIEGKKLWIVDRGSTNGTFLIPINKQIAAVTEDTPKLLRWNNAFLVRKKEQLHHGYIILFGNTELRVSIDEHNGKNISMS